jgi:sulfonate transport system permease protein
MPQIFSGLRLGLAVSWMFVVAAELIAATRGLGYLLSDGRETGRTDWVFAAIALFGLLGKASDSVLKAIEQRSLHWRDTEREADPGTAASSGHDLPMRLSHEGLEHDE